MLDWVTLNWAMLDWVTLAALLLWPAAFTVLYRPERLTRPRRTLPDDAAAEQLRPTDRVEPHGDGVAVVIPARNEEHNLPRLLSALAQQTCPPDELVVVDDNSSDAGASVARAHGARVIELSEPPAGWLGKTRACAAGAEATSSKLLLFLDADCRPSETALEALRAEYRAHNRTPARPTVITVQPYHELERPYEQLSAFFNIVLIAGVAAFTLPRRSAPKGAFGPCVLVSRDCYERAGGHSAVRSEVLDDVALGTRFRSHGCNIRFLIGGDELRFRMYPNGLRELVQGWTKNFAVASSRTPLSVLIALTSWFSGAALALRALATGPILPGGLLYLLYAAQLYLLLRPIGRFRLITALFYPVGLAFFAGVYLRSLFVTYVLRRVTWKGRTVTPHG